MGGFSKNRWLKFEINKFVCFFLHHYAPDSTTHVKIKA